MAGTDAQRPTLEEIRDALKDGTFDEKFELGPEEQLLDRDWWVVNNRELYRGRAVRRKPNA
jgi:hypothetical protein